MKASLSILAFGVVLSASAASGAVIVWGDGPQRACYVAAKTGYQPDKGLDYCEQALSSESLDPRDRAATFVNAGVLEHQLGRPQRAIGRFNDALKVDPMQADAFLNRGVSLIVLKRLDEAMTDVEKGIALGTSEPALAYFDRAIIHEMQGRIREAYLDYRKALEIAPDWPAAKQAIGRFTVRRSPAG